jgi:hypothetical protein
LGDNGGVKVDIVDASGIEIDVDIDTYLDGYALSATPTETGIVVMGTDGSNLQFISVDSSGNVNVNVLGTVTVTATDLDIRDLDHSQDSVAIGDGTDLLDVNADGSINVVTSKGDETWNYASTNLVKDTETTVTTFSPGSTKQVRGFIVSGAGRCIWRAKFGTTSSESTIATMWTTPGDATLVYTFPESIFVDSGESFLVSGENKSKFGSPTSDFTGYVTIITEA